jgi:glucose/arabinose dehydrogenase
MRPGERRRRAALSWRVLLVMTLVGATSLLAPAPTHATRATRAAASGVPPSGFSDVVAISGLVQPTTVAFAGDGRVFVGEKSGLVKVFDSLADTTPTVFADLRTQVHNFWDRGLLGLTLDPQFPTRPYVYALYTYDAVPGGSAPRWGTAGSTGDGCPNPPGSTVDGCVVQARLSRLTASGNQMTGPEQVLVSGWCQQFPSHSIGTVTFGPDGALYVGAGDGASFNYVDYGQTNNPCGDPPSPAGTDLAPPTAQGGALRSQSIRRPAGQPVTLDGAIIRVDPNTGAGLPGNPFASHADPNARRIIAYGLRNPFRFDIRPGTQQLWVGEVGWSTWEEINRIADIDDGIAENFGWPCYEGIGRQGGYDAADLNSCESLYGAGQTGPFYQYNHNAKVVPSDSCPTGSSSVSGVAFENGSNYPSDYDGALFFADASRGCIWVMKRGGGVDPSPGQVAQFVGGAGMPVQVLTGPGGDIFYVDLEGGQVHRVVYNGANHPPTAVISASPTSGAAPLTVNFDGSGSSDLDPGDSLGFVWDLDGDGQFDDSTAIAPTRTYTTSGTFTARLRVTDPAGASDTQSVTITVGTATNSPPVPVIDTPTSSLRWRVGDTISFSGHATDVQDGTLPASRLSWSVVLNHCPSNCHTHPVQSYTGVATGTFPAPDHEYPSSLSLVLTATDSAGASASTSRRLDPQTVNLTFATSPTGLQLAVGAQTAAAPITRTVIVGSSNSVSAPSPQTLGGASYTFKSWSDGGARAHNVIAPATPSTYTATFDKAPVDCPASPSFDYPVSRPIATCLVATGTAAVPAGSNHVVSGNFFGGPRDEMLFHSNDTAREVLLSVSAGASYSLIFRPYNLPNSGLARPIVGDFDGDGFDEIFWYTRGPEADVVWDFTAYNAVTTTQLFITGTFTPVAGDFTADGADDIFFYGPGTAPDVLWEFNPGGGHTELSIPVSGTYVPLVGSFGFDATDDIFWYAAGTAADSLWDFTPGSTGRTSRAIAVNGTYTPFTLDLYGDGAGGGDIFWYAPGTATDSVWDFIDGVRFPFRDPVSGVYRPMSGDYLGDGLDDIVWLHSGGFHLWVHRPVTGGVGRFRYSVTFG